MIGELARAFFLIFAAEMGDKTQILAMTFATQYKIKEVLIGIFIGVFLNHGLAIILGRYLSKFIPMDLIQLIAGVMFVIFGLLALSEEEIDNSEGKKGFGPVMTVALAFFIGELGDKTQLTAMTLSAEGDYPLFILLGTTLGMIGTSGVAIFVGSKVGEKIPDTLIKLVSSFVFVLFGTLKLYEWIPEELLNPFRIMLYFIVVISMQLILAIRLIIVKRRTEKSPMKEVAANLYTKVRILNKAVDDICLGEEKCGDCSGKNCIIGYTRMILEAARDRDEYYIQDDIKFSKLINKDFDQNKVMEALSLIIVDYIRYGTVEDQKFIINQVKESLEMILLGKKIRFDGDLQKYIGRVKRSNYYIGEILQDKIKTKMDTFS